MLTTYIQIQVSWAAASIAQVLGCWQGVWLGPKHPGPKDVTY